MKNKTFFLACAGAGLVLAFLAYFLMPLLFPTLQFPTLQFPTKGVGTGLPLLQGTRANSYHTGIQRAAPAVVSIYSSETIYRKTGSEEDPFANRFGLSNSIAPKERRKTNQGSGVIISDDGYVLTNNHLISGADDINVALADGRLYSATQIGADDETDLAVVKIKSEEDLPSCSITHDSNALVGDIVLAIGNPFGVGQTVTQGIVSATGRHVNGASRLQNFLQIDAAINPGNSGGALINPAGDLVGINTAVFTRTNGAQGIGFAIPTDLIRVVVPEIILHGRVIRGWLGIGAENLHLYPDLYRFQQQGAVISGIFEGSPAMHAGLRPMDIITDANDQKITSSTQLMKLVASMRPGELVRFRAIRQQQLIELDVKLAERPVFESKR